MTRHARKWGALDGMLCAKPGALDDMRCVETGGLKGRPHHGERSQWLWRIRNTQVGCGDQSQTVNTLLITFVDPRCTEDRRMTKDQD